MGKGNYASLTAGLLARKGEAKPAANSVFGHDGLINANTLEDSKSEGNSRPDIAPIDETHGPASARCEEGAAPARTRNEQKEKIEHMRMQIVKELNKRDESVQPDAQSESSAHPTSAPAPRSSSDPSGEPTVQKVQTVSRVVSPNFGLRRRTRQSVSEQTKPGEAGGVMHGADAQVCGAEGECLPEDAALTAKRRAAITLRLDDQRHFVLKMIGVKLGMSGQAMLTKALDAYFKDVLENELSNCACLKTFVRSELESTKGEDLKN